MNLFYKIFSFTSLILLPSFFSFSQNLVPNPSFEQYDTCPYINEFNYVSYWVNPTAHSPDYFNACDTTPQNYSVPSNAFGFQNARTGVAYAGLISMSEIDTREYIQCILIDTLLPGKEYFAEFYVSASDSSPYTANNMGIYFSVDPVSSTTTSFLPYVPQVSNDSMTNPLSNRSVWTKISGTFIAQGGERYITIGNFNNDANTDTTHHPDGSQWLGFSHHYIDDVSVFLLDSVNVSEEAWNYKNVKIFPNPSDGRFKLDFEKTIPINLTVFNFLGQSIMNINNDELQGKNSFFLDISKYSKGIYFLVIETEEFLIINKLLSN
jgi:hypothetical protein